MSRARRFAAALLGALLLQVLSLGSGRVCPVPGMTTGAEHGEEAAHEAGQHAAHHSRAEPASPGDASAHAHDSGDHTPAHCLVAMTCAAPGLVASVATAADDLILLAAVIAARDDAVPPSPGGAPEPPPPRP